MPLETPTLGRVPRPLRRGVGPEPHIGVVLPRRRWEVPPVGMEKLHYSLTPGSEENVRCVWTQTYIEPYRWMVDPIRPLKGLGVKGATVIVREFHDWSDNLPHSPDHGLIRGTSKPPPSSYLQDQCLGTRLWKRIVHGFGSGPVPTLTDIGCWKSVHRPKRMYRGDVCHPRLGNHRLSVRLSERS